MHVAHWYVFQTVPLRTKFATQLADPVNLFWNSSSLIGRHIAWRSEYMYQCVPVSRIDLKVVTFLKVTCIHVKCCALTSVRLKLPPCGQNVSLHAPSACWNFDFYFYIYGFCIFKTHNVRNKSSFCSNFEFDFLLTELIDLNSFWNYGFSDRSDASALIGRWFRRIRIEGINPEFRYRLYHIAFSLWTYKPNELSQHQVEIK